MVGGARLCSPQASSRSDEAQQVMEGTVLHSASTGFKLNLTQKHSSSKDIKLTFTPSFLKWLQKQTKYSVHTLATKPYRTMISE